MRDFFLPGRSPVFAGTAAAATSHPLASCEALSVLRAGGSAADAAIAACAVQCVCEPHMTGVGGDCFAMVRAPGAAPAALNGSGWTPAAMTREWLEEAGVRAFAEDSALAVTVPGAVAAWRALHERHGRLPWRGLFQAAVHYAEAGCLAAPRVAADWRRYAARVAGDGDAAAVFLAAGGGGRAPYAGERFRQPALARTLRRIAADGGESFYRGEIARELVAKLNAGGAPHALADFAEYKPAWERPLAVDFRGWRVWECPPNGQGVTALLMLGLLEDGEGGGEVGSVAGVARFADVTRCAYAWRDRMVGDGGAVGADGWGKAVAAARAAGVVGGGGGAGGVPEHSDTVCLAVVDGRGLAVSLINSLFQPFGSGLLAPRSGVLLHNRGLGFSFAAGTANEVGARRRPLHTIIPAIGEGPGGEVLSFGMMGGHYQAAGHAWFLSRVLECGEDLQAALDAPRVFNYPDALWVEKTLPEARRRELAAAGYAVKVAAEPIGGGQAVLRRADGGLVAASDGRKDGMAVGF